jgi:hypothetical protein
MSETREARRLHEAHEGGVPWPTLDGEGGSGDRHNEGDEEEDYVHVEEGATSVQAFECTCQGTRDDRCDLHEDAGDDGVFQRRLAWLGLEVGNEAVGEAAE